MLYGVKNVKLENTFWRQVSNVFIKLSLKKKKTFQKILTPCFIGHALSFHPPCME